MKKKIRALRKKYASMTTVQQKFIRYVLVIKIAVLLICGALFALAWYLLVGKN